MDDKENEKRQDFADHQVEVSGVQNGRMDRFLTGGDAPRNRVSQAEVSARSFQNLLDLLLSDSAYAVAHARAKALADDVQDKLNGIQTRTAARIEHLEDLADDMDANTARLTDGTAVYRDTQGNLRTADGRHLRNANTASLINPDNILSYERRKAVRDTLQNARVRQHSLSDIQDDIDNARKRLNDPDNPPPSVDDIEDIEDDIRKADRDMNALETIVPRFNAVSDQLPASPDFDLSDDPSIFAAP